MFKKLALLLGVAACINAVSAQGIEYQGGTSHQYTMSHAGSTDCYLIFRNMTGGTGNFVYNKINADFPSAWWVSFCDNINCYASFVQQDTFAPIADSAEAEFKITVTPNGKADTAVAVYEFFEASAPNDKDTLTFTFIVEWGAGVRGAEGVKLGIYPNPANDVLYFQNVGLSSVEIFDASGKLVKSASLEGRSALSIGEMPAGFYFVTCRTGDRILRSEFVKN
jgi:hypothetical protein